MTRDDGIRVLAMLTAAFPSREMSEPEIAQWADTLGPLLVEPAMSAVQVLKAAQKWLPAHSEFLTTYHAEAHRLAAFQAERALGAGAKSTCGECGDSRWVFPGEGDVGRALEKLADQSDSMRAKLADTVRPCRRCNPTSYLRWREGHFTSDHLDHPCGECIDLAAGGSRAAAVTRALTERAAEPERESF